MRKFKTHQSWLFVVCRNSVHPPLSAKGGGGVNLLQNFQKADGGGLNRISIFREELLGKRGCLFSGGCSFYIKIH